jgi:hypothetical protein
MIMVLTCFLAIPHSFPMDVAQSVLGVEPAGTELQGAAPQSPQKGRAMIA